MVKFLPDLIAGYNTMTEDKKRNVDINGLSAFIRNALILIGVIILTMSYLFERIGKTTLFDYCNK